MAITEPEPGSEEDTDRTPSYRIQLCIFRQAADVWASMKSYFCCSDTVSSFEVTALYWPAGDDVKQRDTAVVQDRATLYRLSIRNGFLIIDSLVEVCGQ